MPMQRAGALKARRKARTVQCCIPAEDKAVFVALAIGNPNVGEYLYDLLWHTQGCSPHRPCYHSSSRGIQMALKDSPWHTCP
jgi:hypothetical protein